MRYPVAIEWKQTRSIFTDIPRQLTRNYVFMNVHSADLLYERLGRPPTAMMQKSSSQEKPKLVPRTEPLRARCEPHPSSTTSDDDDRGLEWTEFISHSRLDHDATTCSFCISNRLDQPLLTPIPINPPPAKHKTHSFRRQAARYMSETWSRRRSHLMKVLRELRTQRAWGKVVRWCSRLGGKGGRRERIVSDRPPVLPMLRPFSPLFRKGQIYFTWESDGC